MFGKKKRILKNLREQWGQSIERKRDFKLISAYHKYMHESDKSLVDEATWSDLNMDDLFTLMDRTISPVGSQYLYYFLHKYETNPEILKKRYHTYQFYNKNQNFRESVQLTLNNLERKNAFYLAGLIFKSIPERPQYYYLFYILSFLSIVSIITLFYYPTIVFYAFAVFIINLFVEHRFGKKVNAYIADLSILSTMLRTANRLTKLDHNIDQISKLQTLQNTSDKILKSIGWLTIDKSRRDELSAAFIDYLNHFCLFNLCAFVRAIPIIKEYQLELQKIFKAIGSIDTDIAIGSYLYEHEKHCVPSFNSSGLISFKNLYHPLLEEAVANSLELQNSSCLVTGSNMAGKTTFIKTVGLNCILAQTVGFCHADEINIPQIIVHSTIKRSDELSEHKSYYFKEIEAILEFINLNNESGNYLFLIDEIFRGTNTVERISAATSVLKYLAKYSITFVTTHDIELHELLKNTFEMYHFSEQVDNGNFYFDYKIKKGPCSTRNAIKLLELKGYPKEITNEAIEISKNISTQIN